MYQFKKIGEEGDLDIVEYLGYSGTMFEETTHTSQDVDLQKINNGYAIYFNGDDIEYGEPDGMGEVLIAEKYKEMMKIIREQYTHQKQLWIMLKYVKTLSDTAEITGDDLINLNLLVDGLMTELETNGADADFSEWCNDGT